MSFEIRESQYSGIWNLIYRGEVDLATRLRALDEARVILESKRATGALVDFRDAELRFSTEQSYEFIGEKVSSTLFLGFKTVLLFEKVPRNAEFETVIANNRDLPIRALSDEKQAYDWLRES